MSFDGFSDDTLRYLRELGRHNDKVWFDQHKDDYQAHWLEAGLAFIEALAPGLKKLAPGVSVEPKVNGSIFRIHRDVRFSKDKTPYKDHLDMWFWEGAKKKEAPSGFFFRLKHDHTVVGVGNHAMPKPLLERYRDTVADEKKGKALASLTGKLAKLDYEIGGEHYKKLPRGYAATDVREPLLRHNALWVSLTAPVGPAVQDKAFVKDCLQHYKKMLPLHRWLVDELGS